MTIQQEQRETLRRTQGTDRPHSCSRPCRGTAEPNTCSPCPRRPVLYLVTESHQLTEASWPSWGRHAHLPPCFTEGEAGLGGCLALATRHASKLGAVAWSWPS